jgi:hypothetical protein
MRYLICAVLLVFVASSAGAEPQVVPIPPNVKKVEGMPPIPRSIADDLSRYAAFRDAQLVAWHPTRRQILINSFRPVPPDPSR